MAKWQPIESCPKDGNAFLAGRWNRDRSYWWVFTVHWANGIIDGGWDGAREPIENPCTHWMPLPDPPDSEPEPCNHPRSELLARKGDQFEMHKCLDCTKIFRVRLEVLSAQVTAMETISPCVPGKVCTHPGPCTPTCGGDHYYYSDGTCLRCGHRESSDSATERTSG